MHGMNIKHVAMLYKKNQSFYRQRVVLDWITIISDLFNFCLSTVRFAVNFQKRKDLFL
jgi:hypothetical protein